MTISEQSTNTPTDLLSKSELTQLTQPTLTLDGSLTSPAPITTKSYASPQPTFTLDINRTALIDVISGKTLKDPCFSNCGCNLTLSRKTWMSLPKTDGKRNCPNPTCNKNFKVLTSNWLVASLLNTQGSITPKEHFDEQKSIQEIKKLLKSFDVNIENGETETASQILKKLQKVLPSDSSDIQSRIKKLFEQKEVDLKKRRLPSLPSLQESSSKRQKTSSSKGLNKHEFRILKIRERRDQALNLAIKKEVLKSMMMDDDDHKEIETRTPVELYPEITPIVTLGQVFSKLSTRDSYSSYDILSFVSELIESKHDLSSLQKRDIIDPLWRECFDPVSGLELSKPQLKQLLTAINSGYKKYIAERPSVREDLRDAIDTTDDTVDEQKETSSTSQDPFDIDLCDDDDLLLSPIDNINDELPFTTTCSDDDLVITCLYNW